MTTAEELKKWSQQNRKFISLNDGEEIIFRLVEAKTTSKDLFGEEREIVKYICELPDKTKKVFENGSPALAAKMADLLGKMVVLKRVGVGTKTRYTATEAQDDPTTPF